MAHIILPQRWSAAPPPDSQLDGSALRRLSVCGGYVAAAGALSKTDVLGSPVLFSNDSRQIVDILPTPNASEGVVSTFYRPDSTARQFGFSTGGPNSRNFTFQARVLLTTAVGLSGVVARTDTTLTGGGTTIPLWRPSSAFDMRISGTDYTQAGTWALNTWVDIQIVTTSSSATLYVDGVATIAGGAPANATIQPILAFGGISGGSIGAGELSISYCLISDRSLSVAEMRDFRARPWQIFKPRKRVTFFLGSFGAPTLSLPGVTEIGTTSARPRVYLTY